MDIKNIENLDFASLSSEQAAELGLNSIFQEEDGTYDWIYCMKLLKNLSMMKFVMTVIAIAFAAMVVIMLLMTGGSGDTLWMLGIMGLVFGAVMLIVLFSFWLVDKMYKGSYMLIYEMNEQGITFSQTTDQAQITRAIAASSAAVNAAGGNVGGVIAGTGLALRPNSYHADFSKVRTVKGIRRDSLIWVNTFGQFLQIYVPDEAYDFVFLYITRRCKKARITTG